MEVIPPGAVVPIAPSLPVALEESAASLVASAKAITAIEDVEDLETVASIRRGLKEKLDGIHEAVRRNRNRAGHR